MEKQPRSKSIAKPSAFEVMRERGVFEAKGRKYTVNAITLGDLMDEETLNRKQPAVGYDADKPGLGMYINLQIAQSREMITDYIVRYLKCGGMDMTLAKCIEHGWDLDDLGAFLQVLYRVSG